jgi:hypothetical protein
MRLFRRKAFSCASRNRREPSIRPKISRIDFDVAELESSEVWWGPPEPAVEFHAARRRAARTVSKSASAIVGRASSTIVKSSPPMSATTFVAVRAQQSCAVTAHARRR